MNENLQFAREMADFRDRVSRSHLVMRDAVRQYVAMMDAIGVGFALYYEDMTHGERAEMRIAFEKLREAVKVFAEDNVVPLRTGRE